jgi:hypothetical protein
MYENPYVEGGTKVCYCSTCKSAFPIAWLETGRGAIRKDGRTFCCQSCADNFKTENEHHGVLELFVRSVPQGYQDATGFHFGKP